MRKHIAHTHTHSKTQVSDHDVRNALLAAMEDSDEYTHTYTHIHTHIPTHIYT